MRRMAFAVLAVATALFTGLFTASVAGAQAPAATIDAVDSPGPAYQPANVTISTGEAVRWEYDQAAQAHTLTSSSANWTIDETRSAGGAAIERTFDQPGLYTFLCRFHSCMTGTVNVESDPLDGAGSAAATVAAVTVLEETTLAMPEGIVLRYGYLYGPGTWYDIPAKPPSVHVDAAAQAALLALTKGKPGVYNIAEDDGYCSSDKAKRDLGFDAGVRVST